MAASSSSHIDVSEWESPPPHLYIDTSEWENNQQQLQKPHLYIDTKQWEEVDWKEKQGKHQRFMNTQRSYTASIVSDRGKVAMDPVDGYDNTTYDKKLLEMALQWYHTDKNTTLAIDVCIDHVLEKARAHNYKLAAMQTLAAELMESRPTNAMDVFVVTILLALNPFKL